MPAWVAWRSSSRPVGAVLPREQGGGVPRGARLVGADGERDAAPPQPTAQLGPLRGAQPERAVGQDEVDERALSLVGREAVPQRHVDDRVR